MPTPPRKTASHKAPPSDGAPKRKPRPRPSAEQPSAPGYVPPVEPQGAEMVKTSLSKLFAAGQGFLSDKAPGLLDRLEQVSLKAVDKTAQGLDAFEKKANEVEAKITQRFRKPPSA